MTPPFELEDFVHGHVGQACDTGDAVTDLADAAHLFARDPGREALQVAPEDFGDLGGVDAQLSHLFAQNLSVVTATRHVRPRASLALLPASPERPPRRPPA